MAKCCMGLPRACRGSMWQCQWLNKKFPKDKTYVNAVYAQQHNGPRMLEKQQNADGIDPHRTKEAFGHRYPQKRATMCNYAIFWSISNIYKLSTRLLRVGINNPGVGAWLLGAAIAKLFLGHLGRIGSSIISMVGAVLLRHWFDRCMSAWQLKILRMQRPLCLALRWVECFHGFWLRLFFLISWS